MGKRFWMEILEHSWGTWPGDVFVEVFVAGDGEFFFNYGEVLWKGLSSRVERNGDVVFC